MLKACFSQDKKCEKEQERERAIKEAEVENLLGPRHQESIKIKELLKEKELALFEVRTLRTKIYSNIQSGKLYTSIIFRFHLTEIGM